MVALSTQPSPASVARRAIDLTNKANADPSFAHEACILWRSILEAPDGDGLEPPLPLAAMPAAHALHASALVRVGRDREAVAEYQKAIDFSVIGGGTLTKDEVDIRMGMGKSLQRMLRYDDAADTFLDAAERCANIRDQNEQSLSWVECAHADAVRRAAICKMRVSNLDSAVAILEAFEGQDVEVTGMLGAQRCIQMWSVGADERHELFHNARSLLLDASCKSSSPVYHWLYRTSFAGWSENSALAERLPCKKVDAYLSFAKVNNSPFDDPGLIILDDKVLLHSVVTNNDSASSVDARRGRATPSSSLAGRASSLVDSFWPRGYILPKEWDALVAECNVSVGGEEQTTGKKWMLKERSGYGSHGNSIASESELMTMYDSEQLAESILCQQIVEPPLLIGGRKFSLRIYVIYFPSGNLLSEHGEKSLDAEIYVSKEGLVKYASALYVDEVEKSDDQYMTNSGRGDGTSSIQHDLQQLQSEFERNGFDYNATWRCIEQSIQMLMRKYLHVQSESVGRNKPICSIPKILGFDYILDSSARPFLLEVNRFPGLEPRSSQDSDVKQYVIYDAWVAACNRIGVPRDYIENMQPSSTIYRGFSLRKLALT